MNDERVRVTLVAAYVVGLGLSITLAETALAALGARALWRVATGRAGLTWPLAWPIAVWIAVTALAAALAARPGESLYAARFVLLVLALWVMLDALPDAGAAMSALRGLLAVLGLAALVGVAQVAFCAELTPLAPTLGRVATKCHRAHAFYSIYMTFAGVLNVVLLATLPALLASSGKPRWAGLAWLAGLVGLALTYVRGAWLGFGAGVAALAAMLRRGRGVLLGGLGVVAVALLLLPGVSGRARTIGDVRDPTTSERLLMWRSGLAMARDHLLTGVGPGQVRHVYPRYAAPEVVHKHRGHLHSAPVQILVERGLLGLAAWGWLFAAFFLHAARVAAAAAARDDTRGRALVTGAIGAIAGFLVAGLTEHNFGDTEVLLVALLVMAVVFVVERDASRA